MQLVAINYQKNLSSAFYAVAEDSEVAQVRLESVFTQNGPFDWLEHRLIQLEYSSTLSADEMMMMSFFYGMITKFSTPEVSLGH